MNAEEVVRAEMNAWSSLDVDQIVAYFAGEASFWPGFGAPRTPDSMRSAASWKVTQLMA